MVARDITRVYSHGMAVPSVGSGDKPSESECPSGTERCSYALKESPVNKTEVLPALMELPSQHVRDNNISP